MAPRFRVAVIVYFVVIWLGHLPYQVVMRFRQPVTENRGAENYAQSNLHDYQGHEPAQP